MGGGSSAGLRGTGGQERNLSGRGGLDPFFAKKKGGADSAEKQLAGAGLEDCKCDSVVLLPDRLFSWKTAWDAARLVDWMPDSLTPNTDS